MKIFLTVYFAVILIQFDVWGQPGGGGGVIIQTLIDKNGTIISSNDPELQIRKFVLSDNEGLSVKEYYKSQENSSFPRHYPVKPGGLYIRPYLDFFKTKTIPHQLIQFIYKSDTVSVEFEGIMMENGTGYSDWLDSLQLIPGSYRFSFNFIYAYNIPNGTANDRRIFDSIFSLARRGLTNSTIPMLRPLQIAGILNNKRLTTIYQNANYTYDTVCLPVKPVYQMNLQSVITGDNHIELKIDERPMWERDTTLYRILVNIPALNLWEIKNKLNNKQLEAITFSNSSSVKKLYINNTLYTGYLKIFVPFYQQLGRYNGVSLRILYFDKGVLLRSKDEPDISLDESHVPVRPS